MMRILTPKGVLREAVKAVPVCEARIVFNGKTKRAVEAAKDMDSEPTALSLIFEQNAIPFVPRLEPELFIGNLKPEAVKEIMQKLLSDGSYDFSGLNYQKAETIEKTVFDKGATAPYTTDYMSGAGGLFYGCGCPVGIFPAQNPVNSFDDKWDKDWEEADDEQE